MTEQNDGEKKSAVGRKIAVRVMVLALLFIAALYLFLNVILNTPQATGRISRLLSDTLHQPATVEGINLAGGTFFIRGLTIANPPAFNGGNLLVARTITVTPSWSALLAGQKSFTAIGIRGLKLSLAKNSTGAWNFSGLKELFGKKSAGETFIKRLVLESSTVSVNGRRITDISLAINNFSTKGSTGSGILLTFNDDFGSPYRLEGGARLGVTPSLDFSLSVPSFSCKALRKFKLPLDPEKGKGTLLLKARMHGDQFKLDGNAAFDRLTLLLMGEGVPLTGALDFSAAYDVKEDIATLEKCALQVDGVIRLKARGKVERVKKERAFTAEISHDSLEVSNLFALIPRKLRGDLLTGGTLLPGTFHIAGTGAAGITYGSGGFSLRHGKLGKGERMFVKKIAADAVLAGAKAGWELHGRVSQSETTAGVPVRLQDIPFTALFSSRMRLLEAQVPSFKAGVAGIPVKGKVLYTASAPVPLNAMVETQEAPIAPITGLFPVTNLEIAKGSLTASIRITGRVPGEIRGDVIAGVTELRGTYGGKKFALAEASTRASGGKTAVNGDLKINGRVLDGKKVAASFAYRLADGQATLTGGDCAVDKTNFRFTEINGVIPQRVKIAGVAKLPLKLRFNGIRCQREGIGVDAISGNLNVLLISSAGERWLQGEGALSAPSLTYGGKGVGSLSSRIILARKKDAVELSGKILDGNLTASASGDLFTGQRKGIFTVNLSGMAGSRFPELLGKRVAFNLSRGKLDAAVTGDLSAQNSVRCHMILSGADLALTDKNGRTLLTGGGLRLDSEWVDGSLQVREGVAILGKEMEIALHGKLSRAAASDREGEFNLSMPKKASLGALLDNFANILPRSLQEAAATGNMEAKAMVRIKGKRVALDGEMNLEDGGVEISSQKLTIAGINGTIPFAVDFAEKAPPKLPERLSFTRENYSRLLTTLQQTAKSGQTLAIETIRFGTTEFGKTTIAIQGENGWTEIVSLSSGLFQGALLGRGFFRYQGGAQYGADILIHDLSLRELCNSYPAIKGYLSGRVDGFVSLFGKEKGLNDMKGLVEIWTRGVTKEKMLVSKEFLQKLAGKKIKGLFFQNDRPYDRGEIGAYLDEGYLTFATLDISHTNILGIKDLSVSVAPVQNRISLDHLFTTIREAATRGKAASGGVAPEAAPASSDFKWEE